MREGTNGASNDREGRMFKALETEWDFRPNSNVRALGIRYWNGMDIPIGYY
jgi:hypothetical protein